MNPFLTDHDFIIEIKASLAAVVLSVAYYDGRYPSTIVILTLHDCYGSLD